MAKRVNKMSVIKLNPPRELTFSVPEPSSKNTDVTAHLTLHNPTDANIMFKVKTTAPKRYCVKPNSGELAAHSTETVKVMLQPPFPPKLQLEEPCKDKFLVVTVKQTDVPAGDWDKEKVWKNETSRAFYMENKLKCIWESADEAQSSSRQPAVAAGSTGHGSRSSDPAASTRPPTTVNPASLGQTAVKAPADKVPAKATKPSPVAVAVPSQQQQPALASILLVFLAFMLGVLMGKYII